MALSILLLALIFANPGVAEAQVESDVVARILSLPPEYAADRLLFLAAREKDPDAKKEMASLAFAVAGSARAPHPSISLARMDSVANRLAASSVVLNRLALRVRAIRVILDDDPELARQWFQRLDLAVPTQTCRDTGIPDYTDYFRLAAAVAQRFRADEKEEGHDLVFVRSVLNSVQLSSGLDGAVLLVRDAAGLRRRVSGAGLLYGDLAQLFRSVALEPLAAERIVPLADILAPLLREPEVAALIVPAFQDYLRRVVSARSCLAHINWPSKSLVRHLELRLCPSGESCGRLDDLLSNKAPISLSAGPDADAQGAFWRRSSSATLLKEVRSMSAGGAQSAPTPDQLELLLSRIEALPDGTHAHASALERLALLKVLLRYATTDRLRERIEHAFLVQVNTLDDGTKPTLWFLYASEVLTLSSRQSSASTSFAQYIASDPILGVYRTGVEKNRRKQ